MRTRKPPLPLERQTQSGLAQLIEVAISPGWLWTASAVGSFRPSARLQKMGLHYGWPDMQFVAPGGQWFGLELKRKKTGRIRPSQIAFAAHCREHSIAYAVADDDEQAIKILTGWGAIRKVRPQ